MDLLKRISDRISRDWDGATRHRTVPDPQKPGFSPGPRYLQIQLTYKCNMSCYFCGQWGSSGTYGEMSPLQLRGMLPLETLKKVVDDLPPYCTSVMLWGGETLLYPDIAALVRHISESRRACDLVTNGTTLARHARALVEAGVSLVQVSIDATEEIHDRIRGRGAYKRALDGIRALKEERERQGRTTRIEISTTIIPDNIEDLPNLADVALELGVDRMWISKVMHTTGDVGDHYQRRFHEYFGVNAGSWKGFVRAESFEAAPAAIRVVLTRLRADPKYRDVIGWENDWSPSDFAAYYEDSRFMSPPDRKCRYPWDAVCIYPDGDLSPCPSFPDYIVGNINEETFSDIWHGERFRLLREKLYADGNFPICSICCQLYTD